jgi:hypothetical protein
MCLHARFQHRILKSCAAVDPRVLQANPDCGLNRAAKLKLRFEGHAMATGNWSNTSRRTVVGYFADGADAHRAINDLLAEGFRPGEIGAAFHSGIAAVPAPSVKNTSAGTPDMEIRPAVGPNAERSGSTTAGAASDSSSVTPAGLSTGGGTATSGAERPGPIPGAEIPGTLPTTLPHTIHSTLPSTLHPNPDAPLPSQQVAPAYPATGGFHETPGNAETDWGEKLKHVFGGESDSPSAVARRQGIADQTSTNFGTGEGHIGAYPDYDYAFSSAALESAFFGMGIPPAHARQLSGRIRRGGAILTVDSGSRSEKAEQIMERNRGTIGYEEAAGTAASSAESIRDDVNREDRVQIFGRVQRVYPGYVSSTGEATRKAS